MNKVIVIYKSKYGSTKRYAEWIAEELHCDLAEAKTVSLDTLKKYDTIVYGGGLYASGIQGISLITDHFTKLKEKKIVIFTVGLANPEIKEQFLPILNKNFTEEMQKQFSIFHLRGGIDYSALILIHKSMMAVLVKMVRKKPEETLTDEDKQLLDTYGGSVDFCNRASIKPLISNILGNS